MSMTDFPTVKVWQLQEFKRLVDPYKDTFALMLNLNSYKSEAGYTSGELFKDYMAELAQLVLEVDGKILLRIPVNGVVVGEQKIN